jgi:lon-related putative ATP-dependent protease
MTAAEVMLLDAPAALAPDDLRRTCDPRQLGFATTSDVEPLDRVVGQPRAVEALDLALGLELPGYHVFVTGPPGTGRRTAAEAHLRRRAAARPAPPDRVYVFNFSKPRRPLAITLPAGRGPDFAGDVDQLVGEARRRLQEAFESEHYRERHQRLHDHIDSERHTILEELQARARTQQVALELTPAGVVMLPLVDGRAVPPQEMEQLPAERLEAHREAVRGLEEVVGTAFSRLRSVEREEARAHRTLDREIASFAVGHLVEDATERWAAVPAAADWLRRLADDVLGHLRPLVGDGESGDSAEPPTGPAPGPDALLSRYEVNVFVSNDASSGAPVIVAADPTYDELFGRVEYEAVLGATVTDHRHVHAGAVHRASGGYLLLQATDVLTRPFAWPRLKQILRTGRAGVENLGRELLVFPTVSLDPEPFAVELTVVLVGTPRLYEAMLALDEDVAKLFKVRADFDVEMPWDAEGERAYARLVSHRVRAAGLPPFEASAVARLIEHGARLAGGRSRLTTRLGAIADVVDEAAQGAMRDGVASVAAAAVEDALRARRRRSDLVEQRLHDRLRDGTLMVDVDGAAVGQVNGLAVALVADHAFGYPVRITATVAPGKGELVDLDREAELSGPIHNKGFFILAGYLRNRYASDGPLALRAGIVFEQSYATVEGDSASSAELYALLSALAGAPVRQDVAVTGSVDQRGRIQPIGAVNEKIEGFFATCRERGLSGRQGVLIPAANLDDLMLDPEVVEAVCNGQFHIWAARTVDEGIALLTGLPAGARGPDGTYPEGTLHGRVHERLAELAEQARRAAREALGAAD